MSIVTAPAAIAEPDVALYGRLTAAERYIHHTRDQAMLALLRRHDRARLSGLRILELGCGLGSLLRSLLHYGAGATSLHGIDADMGGLAQARGSLPDGPLAVADVGALPYRDRSFDLAFAFTVFSSVRDERTRADGAAEAMRVLRPGGLLVVYDFVLNPTNARVRAIGPGELRRLFDPLPVAIERLTLAPPIVRMLGGRRALCAPLERLPFLRTHMLAAVVKSR